MKDVQKNASSKECSTLHAQKGSRVSLACLSHIEQPYERLMEVHERRTKKLQRSSHAKCEWGLKETFTLTMNVKWAVTRTRNLSVDSTLITNITKAFTLATI